MEWIDVKKQKPKQSCMCYVINARGGEGGFLAIYSEFSDVFKMYDPKMFNHPCIDVTHWVPLPTSFVE